jgi:hypothetical protein
VTRPPRIPPGAGIDCWHCHADLLPGDHIIRVCVLCYRDLRWPREPVDVVIERADTARREWLQRLDAAVHLTLP